jgi:hypothetical protein
MRDSFSYLLQAAPLKVSSFPDFDCCIPCTTKKRHASPKCTGVLYLFLKHHNKIHIVYTLIHIAAKIFSNLTLFVSKFFLLILIAHS